jgi:hypothetical protein
MQGAVMADDTDDPDAAADRLDAALERIAHLVARLRPGHVADPDEAAMSPDEIAARLDILIGRLRSALGRSTD